MPDDAGSVARLPTRLRPSHQRFVAAAVEFASARGSHTDQIRTTSSADGNTVSPIANAPCRSLLGQGISCKLRQRTSPSKAPSNRFQTIRSEPSRFGSIMNNHHFVHRNRSATPSRQRLLDRYKQYLQFAELKSLAGDRIGAENDYQHAEHFFRSAAEQKDADRP